MSSQRRYLVVANRTLGGQALLDAVSERLARAPCRFHLLVPATPRADVLPAGGYTDAFLAAEGFVPPVLHIPADDEARKEEDERRLAAGLQRLSALGAEVDGSLGDPDPIEAIREALQRDDYDEIILSTLPAGMSRWLALDLPSRVQRRFDVPLTHVVSTEAAEV